MFKPSTVKFGVFVVVAIGLLALAQAAAGPFVASAAITRPQAQDPPPTAEAKTEVSSEVSYADLFIQKFAERLGVDEDTLNTAYMGALSDTLNQAVQDGKLTQADADAIVQKMGAAGLRTLAVVPDKFDAKSLNADHEKFYVDVKLFVIRAFAQALGISDEELRDQWASGKSVADVAQARGLNLDQVKQSTLRNLKTELDQAVQSGKLPQSEADKIYQDIEAQMDRLMSGS